ncbi:MAG: hypothetical protein IK010_02190 [Bacteroidales bacterium]|nr:hypothetical protein [Bacteroidales bacterium]MBR5092090.1 hypothetical protein [Bacteroidales bacterium]
MKNRKVIRFWAVMVAAALLAVSCIKKPEDNRLVVSQEQLTGLWVKANNPYEFWRFRSDLTGITWDETPDPETGDPEMTEELSNLGFTWAIENGDVLMFSFPGAMENQDVPKYYYITEINASTMKWEDEYGLTYTLNKK